MIFGGWEGAVGEMAAFYLYPKDLPEAKCRTNFSGRDSKTANTDCAKWLLVTTVMRV